MSRRKHWRRKPQPEPSKSIVLAPTPYRDPPPPPPPQPPDTTKLTIEVDGQRIVLQLVDRPGQLTATVTFDHDQGSEARELSPRVVQSVKHTVERLLVVMYTSLDRLCASCGHEKCLHIGRECAGDLYSNGRLCHCTAFVEPARTA